MVEIVQAVLAGITGVKTTIGIYAWVADYLQKRGREARSAEMKKWLEDLGCLSEPGIRQIVEDWARGPGSRFTTEQREELIGLLVNLARGARFVTSQGVARSSFLRCERLIDQLLGTLSIVRKRGELVSPGFNWRLEQYLGKGSFGEVWLGRSTEGFPTPWAFKFFVTPDGQEWVWREKDNLNRLKEILGDDPHIIRYEFVAIEGQQWPFVAFEYAAGGSLEEWIYEEATVRPPLKKHEAIRGIVLGLAKAHANHIFHRDLKLANILLTDRPDVQPKISDFGLAKIDATPHSIGSTYASKVLQVGTKLYLPPEAEDMWREREPAQDDIFALGVIWYQLIVERLERPPYDFADRLLNHGIDTHTTRLIGQCLAHPDRRYRNAVQLAEEMDDVAPPEWKPPAGFLDVQPIVREFLAGSASK